MEDKISPELSDIIEMISRYCASNKSEVAFVWSFVALKKDNEHKCDNCGDDCNVVDEEKSRLGAFGDLDCLRFLLEELRDEVEDSVDEDGFVNF